MSRTSMIALPIGTRFADPIGASGTNDSCDQRPLLSDASIACQATEHRIVLIYAAINAFSLAKQMPSTRDKQDGEPAQQNLDRCFGESTTNGWCMISHFSSCRSDYECPAFQLRPFTAMRRLH